VFDGCWRIWCGGGRSDLRGRREWEWRTLHNEKLFALYCLPNTVHVIKNEIGGAQRMWGRGTYRVLVGKPEGMRPLGSTKCRCEYSMKMYFQKLDRGTWTGLIWLRLGTGGGVFVNAVTFRLHKMQGISRLAEDLLASLEGLCSMEPILTCHTTTG
jgi:hypothetical protein